MILNNIEQRIKTCREKSFQFFNKINSDLGVKYTINHDLKKYPSAELYGTWSYVLGKSLTSTKEIFNEFERESLINSLKKFRQTDGTFYPKMLNNIKNSKSHEYLKLHTSNYAMGAMIKLDENFDFQSTFFDQFLEADRLQNWLDQRSFIRPWEESNNIVNVASYLALCDTNGDLKAKRRLYQMLDWHEKFRNSKSGGFDKLSLSKNHIVQSMAGAVHNFHIYHYLGEKINYEEKIANNVIPHLFEGPLTACLSIDFVELACYSIDHLDTRNQLVLANALLYHLDSLLNYQNNDGGWNENETAKRPTTAAGMIEKNASSCSYATWFRLCSIAMISKTLLNDNHNTWEFRSDLGMGYHSKKWTKLNISSADIKKSIHYQYKLKNIPSVVKKKCIEFASKII